MKPSEAKSVFKILDKSDVNASQSVKRLFLEDIYDKSFVSGSASAKGVKYSPAKFVTQFTGRQAVIKELFGRKEYADILRTTNAMKRLADRANTDGSPTEILRIMGNFARGMITINPLKAGKTAVELSGKVLAGIAAPNWLANTMTTKAGREALMKVVQTSGTTRAIAARALLETFIPNDALTSSEIAPQ